MMTKEDFLSQYEDATNETDFMERGEKTIFKKVEKLISLLENGESLTGRRDIYRKRHGAFKCHVKWGVLDVIPAKMCPNREAAIKHYKGFLALLDAGVWEKEIEATYYRFNCVDDEKDEAA